MEQPAARHRVSRLPRLYRRSGSRLLDQNLYECRCVEVDAAHLRWCATRSLTEPLAAIGFGARRAPRLGADASPRATNSSRTPALSTLADRPRALGSSRGDAHDRPVRSRGTR